MVLKERDSISSSKEYYCDLTEELDQLAGFNTTKYHHYKHYLMYFENNYNGCVYAIRVPGRTVGGVWIDKNNRIYKIVTDNIYVKFYPDNLDEKLQKYIGKKIEFEG